MFYWKNAVVLIALFGIATWPAFVLIRGNSERALYGRLILAALAIVAVALSPLPLVPCLFVYALLLMAASTPKVPLFASWLFFYIWTPAAGIYLGFSGLYLGVMTPGLLFAMALLFLYITTPAYHGRRGVDSSDIWLLIFLLTFWVCSSLRGSLTDAARSLINYVIIFGVTYQILSRTRITNVELTLRLFLYAAAAASLLCLFETVWKWPLYAALNDLKVGRLEGVPRMMLMRAGIVRSYGPFPHPLAGSAIFGMAGVAFFAFLQMRKRSWPVLALGGMILLGLIATVSRTGILAFSVGGAVFAILRGHKTFGGIIIVTGLLLLISAPILSQADAQGSALYRYSLMTEAPILLGNHVWLGYREALANGMLDSLRQGQGIIDLVNVYISLIIIGGVASLVPYLIFLGTTIQRYRALRRARPNREQLLLGQACLAMQFGYVAMAPFIGAWSGPMLLSCLWTALLAALRSEALRNPKALTGPARDEPSPEIAAKLPAFDQLPALR